MQATKRYALLAACILMGYVVRYIFITIRNSLWTLSVEVDPDRTEDGFEIGKRTATLGTLPSKALLDDGFEHCSLNTCLNFSRCAAPFRVHVYPSDDSDVQRRKYYRSDKWPQSEAYKKILRAIKTSRYYTNDPQLACIFVLSFDTLDRDLLSLNYNKELSVAMKNLPANAWNKGSNHLVFNLYFGTWPFYKSSDFGVDFDRAILAKASFSYADLRPSFDLSLPLFPQNWPSNSDESIKKEMETTSNLKPINCSHFISDPSVNPENRSYACIRYGKPYLLTFKGKRYTYGIGSASRNVLYHLHNGKDVIMLTTCRHGRNWEKTKDERCDRDNAEYDRWNYDELLASSTFCLIPKGRRLGSYRFLEALAAGCIPVILADGWVPPFAEVLDWKRAIVVANESQIFQIPDILRSFTEQRVNELRLHAKSFYRHYFFDVEKILDTTLEVIGSRIFANQSPPADQWNSLNGGIWAYLPAQYSGNHGALKYPWFKTWPESVLPNLTAVVSIFRPFHGYFSKVKKFLKELLGLPYIQKIYLLIHFSSIDQILSKYSVDKVQVLTKSDKRQGLFYGFDLHIESDAVIFMDLSSPFKISEINAALKTYKLSPHRLISYNAYDEIFDESSQTFVLVDESETKCYSIAADSGLIMDRFYFDWLIHQTMDYSARKLSKTSVDFSACFDLIQNAVVGRLIDDQSPIKLISEQAGPLQNDTSKVQPAASVYSIDLNQKKLCFDRYLSSHKYLRLASRFLHRRVCSKSTQVNL